MRKNRATFYRSHNSLIRFWWDTIWLPLLMLFRAMIYSNCTMYTVQNTFLFRIIWNTVYANEKKNNSSVIFCGLNKFAFELRNWVIFHICTENIVYSTTRGECRWLHLNSSELAVNGHLVACFGNKSFQIIKMLVEDCSLFFSSFCFFEFGNKSNFCRFKKKMN